MRVSLLRWRAVLSAVVMAGTLAACGGSGGKPAPATATHASEPPVSVSVKAVDTYAHNRDGILGLWLAMHGSAPARAEVTVKFDVPTGKKLTAYYETPKSEDWDHWPRLSLKSSPGPKAGLDTLTGSYSVPLDRDLWRLLVKPQYGPSTEPETVPVHASLTAGGRTLATDTDHAALAAVTVAPSNGTTSGGALHRNGHWTEADYTVTNDSTRRMSPVYAGFWIDQCNQDDISCDSDPSLLEDFAIQKYDGHRWISLPPSHRTARRVLSTSLEAGAEAKLRIRFAPTADLGKSVDGATVYLGCTGKMTGAKRGSYNVDSQKYDIK